jgi:hypothetical protein
MEGDTLQLRDLVPAEPMIPHPGLPWWAWTILALCALLLAGLAVLLLVLHRRVAFRGMRPVDRDAVYREAVEAIHDCVGLSRREAALRASGAIRLYLAKVCQDPSLYETHEEFISRHHALERFPEITREQVSMLLTRLAALKYDLPDPAGTPPDFTEQPLSVLRQVHQQSAA